MQIEGEGVFVIVSFETNSRYKAQTDLKFTSLLPPLPTYWYVPQHLASRGQGKSFEEGTKLLMRTFTHETCREVTIKET